MDTESFNEKDKSLIANILIKRICLKSYSESLHFIKEFMQTESLLSDYEAKCIVATVHHKTSDEVIDDLNLIN